MEKALLKNHNGMGAEGNNCSLPQGHPSPQLLWGEAFRHFGLTGTELGQNQQVPGLCTPKLVSNQGWPCQGSLPNLHWPGPLRIS